MVAKKYNRPVIALAGKVEDNIEVLYDKGFNSIFSIVQGVTTLEDALEKGKENLEKTVANIIRLIKIIASSIVE